MVELCDCKSKEQALQELHKQIRETWLEAMKPVANTGQLMTAFKQVAGKPKSTVK